MNRKLFSDHNLNLGNINALKKNLNSDEQKSGLERCLAQKKLIDEQIAKYSEDAKQTPEFAKLQTTLEKLETIIVELKTVLPASAIITPGFAHIATAGKDFIMGDAELVDDGKGGKKYIFKDNPPHKVTFTYNFQVGQTDLTFAEYDLFCEETGRDKPGDRGWGREKRPVINVSFNDAIAYCNWRSGKEGLPKAFNEKTGELLDEKGKPTTDITKVKGYRLPTESEYEYVARGGKTNRKYGTASGELKADETVYNTDKTSPVGSKKPIIVDGQQIDDWCGNVWKWCLDWYDDKFFKKDEEYTNPLNSKKSSIRVLRGGSWNYIGDKYLRSSYRNNGGPDNSDNNFGFRLTRTVQ